MKCLDFENRVSLTQKNENLKEIIESLASDYKNREDFLGTPCSNTEIKTSEVCSGGYLVCAAGVGIVFIAAVIASVYAAVAGFSWAIGYNYDTIEVDSVIYKNIV